MAVPAERESPLIALLQRVTEASVSIDGSVIGRIGAGLVALTCVEPADDENTAAQLAERVCRYRIFEDAAGRMNRSAIDCGHAVLAVPQFTLAANTNKGLRPSFSSSAPADQATRLFDDFCNHCRSHGVQTETGRFGATMQVALVNDGPVTFWLSN